MMATIGEDIEQILRERLDELEAIEAPSLPDFNPLNLSHRC
jgi:hypothetical protein